jgi:hypothetical protein
LTRIFPFFACFASVVILARALLRLDFCDNWGSVVPLKGCGTLGFVCPFHCYFAFFWPSGCNILTVVVHLFSTHKRSFSLVFEGDFDCFCSDPIESPCLSCQMSLIGGEPCD